MKLSRIGAMWKPFYAWRPVFVELTSGELDYKGQWVWLTWVERRTAHAEMFGGHSPLSRWMYKPKGSSAMPSSSAPKHVVKTSYAYRSVFNAALEEAARICEKQAEGIHDCHEAAEQIRAMKIIP